MPFLVYKLPFHANLTYLYVYEHCQPWPWGPWTEKSWIHSM